MQFGLDPLFVGEYTPYELTLLVKQKQKRDQDEYENMLCLSWHVEAFARQKRLPTLAKVLRDARKKPKKKVSKSDAILKAMAAEKGIII
ncbi:MAG: hypothetical protein OSJ83_08380 [Clostridia bacterium]|nr:hypothetical protein [Clostridia bacterium]